MREEFLSKMDIFNILNLIGSFAFAFSGALAAVKKDMDLFGVTVLAFVTEIGGGVLRDLLLGNTPVFILIQPIYTYISIAAAILTILFHKYLFKISSIILLIDAVGLGTFVCIGVSKALEVDVTANGAIILGLITGVAGGIVRDIFSREIPIVFTRELYAVTCIGGGIIYVLLNDTVLNHNTVMLISALFVITIRIIAIKFNLNLIRASSINLTNIINKRGGGL